MEKEKLIFTFVIPAYNAEKHLNISLPSILNENMYEQDLFKYYEVIVVDDGSKDDTFKVATEYANKWNKKCPGLVRVIKKENGQYGSVINRGIKEANGKYIKILDADDCFNTSVLIELIYIFIGLPKIDVVFVDHVFAKTGSNKEINISYKKWFLQNDIMDISKQKFPKQIITMHSIIYRTQFLRDIKYKQLEGIYYSDSQYSLIPLLHAKNVYYSSLPLYYYFIGRDEQSINMKNMVKNVDHQFQVLSKIIKINFHNIKSKNIKKYAIKVAKSMILWHIYIMCNMDNIRISKKITELFKYIKKVNPKNYYKITTSFALIGIKMTKNICVRKVLKIGAKLYSKFKINILSEW